MKGYDAHLIDREGVALTAHVQPGDGLVVVFQHGLCGDAAQPAEVFPSGQGIRHAVLECRGHGASAADNPAHLSIADFAADVAAMVDTLGIRPLALGGISMGAAIALRLAVLRPDLVPALILARPAWVLGAQPDNMMANAEVGALIAAGRGAQDFAASATAQRLPPDNFATLTGFFNRSPRDVTAALLTRISTDGPGVTRADLAALKIPTLILATDDDVIHPVAHARALAAMIPGANLTMVPPKGRDRPAHVAGMQAAILNFLKGSS